MVNTLVFSGTNYAFRLLTDHGDEERKRHDLALERLQRARDQWNEDRMKKLDFINKRLCEANKAKNITEYLQGKVNLYHLSLNYQIFISPQKKQKNG